jgi:hypothetical protein
MEDRASSNASPTIREILVRDQMSPVTRKERLYLLVVSIVGIAMVTTGLVPSKIATFGIELDSPNRDALLLLLALVNVYFLLAFSIYAVSDYMARREALRTANEREEEALRYQEVGRIRGIGEEGARQAYAKGELQPDLVDIIEATKPLAVHGTNTLQLTLMGSTRVFFDFWLPIIVGLVAIYILVSRSLF